MDYCPKCYASVRATAKFCVRCGFNIRKYAEENAPQACFCPECGTQFSGGNFCPECGYDVSRDLTGGIGGFDFSGLEQAAKAQLTEQAGLEIQGTVLVKYTGKSRNVTIPQGVTEIYDDAFKNNEILSSVHIPESVNIIGKSAFEGCKYLKSLTLPSEMEEIYGRAFWGCGELEQVILPQKITQIRQQVFGNCGSLKSITIPDSVTQIQYDAFVNCHSLCNIYITSLSAWCSLLGAQYLMAPNRKNKLYLNNAPITELVIPASIAAIGDHVFSGCGELISVSFPRSLQRIGISAFRSSGLRKLTIPSHITDIGKNAFAACKDLTRVAIGMNIPSYNRDEGLFFDCPNLRGVTFANSVTGIGAYAFYRCTGLTGIEIPDSVTSICANAFSDCTALASVRLPNTLTRIEDGVFLNCASLRSIAFPNSVTEIGRQAFGNCRSLTAIPLPNSLTCIQGSAFQGCSGIRSIRVPDSVQSIGCGAFHDCTQLEEITLPFVGEKFQNNKYREMHFGYIFGGCSRSTPGCATGKKYGYYYDMYSESYQDCVEDTGYYYPVPESLKRVTILGGNSCNFSGCGCISQIQLPAACYNKANKNVDFWFCYAKITTR